MTLTNVLYKFEKYNAYLAIRPGYESSDIAKKKYITRVSG